MVEVGLHGEVGSAAEREAVHLPVQARSLDSQVGKESEPETKFGVIIFGQVFLP